MKSMNVVLILSALMVLNCDGRRSQKEYKINIDEKGTQFSETVEINAKENSVVYKVPKHNSVAQSETLFDYKTGYFATRIPELKECYIQPILKGQSSPRYIEKYLQQYRAFKRSNSTVPVKTIATTSMKERRIELKRFSSSLSAFCGDFVAYKVKQIYHQNRNGKNVGRYVRTTIPKSIIMPQAINITFGGVGIWKTITLNTCQALSKYFDALEKGGCAKLPDTWKYDCHIKTKTCMYTVRCKLVIPVNGGRPKHECDETHFYTGWTCCDVKC